MSRLVREDSRNDIYHNLYEKEIEAINIHVCVCCSYLKRTEKSQLLTTLVLSVSVK